MSEVQAGLKIQRLSKRGRKRGKRGRKNKRGPKAKDDSAETETIPWTDVPRRMRLPSAFRPLVKPPKDGIEGKYDGINPGVFGPLGHRIHGKRVRENAEKVLWRFTVLFYYRPKRKYVEEPIPNVSCLADAVSAADDAILDYLRRSPKPRKRTSPLNSDTPIDVNKPRARRSAG